MGEPGKPSIYSNFCPEVAFERFGLFALNFAGYADEIDLGLAHDRLGRMKAPATDWRWACPLLLRCTTQSARYTPLSISMLLGKDQGAMIKVHRVTFPRQFFARYGTGVPSGEMWR